MLAIEGIVADFTPYFTRYVCEIRKALVPIWVVCMLTSVGCCKSHLRFARSASLFTGLLLVYTLSNSGFVVQALCVYRMDMVLGR